MGPKTKTLILNPPSGVRLVQCMLNEAHECGHGVGLRKVITSMEGLGYNKS